MKTYFVIKSFYFLCLIVRHAISHKFELHSTNHSNLAVAISKIVDKLASNDIKTANIITSLGELEDYELKDFRNKLSKKCFMTEISLRQESRMFNIGRKRFFSLILLNTFDDFVNVYKKISSDKFHFNGFYLIVLLKEASLRNEKIFEMLWKLQIHNAIVMFEDENDDISINTFFPFNDSECSMPVLINKFQSGKFSNESIESFFPEKMKNLNNCSILVSLANSTKPFVNENHHPNGTFTLTGREIELMNTLSSALNFHINYTYLGHEGFILANGTAKGPFKALLDGEAELSIGVWWLKLNRLKFFDTTTPYYSDEIVFIIPPGRDLTTFEKLTFPFKTSVWIIISIFFFIGHFVIFIFKRQVTRIQNFIFGSGIKNPYLNMFIGLVGGTQHILPKTNFARFLLMSFLLYSLVIRTLYQGSFYQIMQSNIQHKEVQSIEQMIAEDFVLFSPLANSDLLETLAMRKM